MNGLATGLALFDLDGTLVDSAPDIADAVDVALTACGHAPIGEGAVRNYIGNGAQRLLHCALTGARDGEAEPALHAQAYAEFVAAYQTRLFVRTRIFAGVVDVLAMLASRGWLLGCITNKPQRFTRPLLQAAELEQYFGIVLSGDSLATKKPDPEPILHAAALLQVPLARVVMVGDSSADLDAARNAGVAAIAVSYGYAGGTDLTCYGVPVIADLRALLPLLHNRAGIRASA